MKSRYRQEGFMLICESEDGDNFAIMLPPNLKLLRRENDKLIFFDNKLKKELVADLPK